MIRPEDRVSSESGDEVEQLHDFSLDVAQSAKLGLRMTMSIVPIVGLFIALALFKKKFILTEQKMQEITDNLKTQK